MKVIRFFFIAVITLTATYFLNFEYNEIPPMGKLLSPFSGVWANGEKEPLEIEEVINGQLKADANVVFDQLIIPHVYTSNDYDAYYIQGYLTAYHRLWQMDISTRATAGRISEFMGEKALEFDKTQRRKGLAFGAERLLEEVKKEPKIFEMLQAYSDGINAYIDQMSYADYPIEYKLTSLDPEPWSPFKSCLMMKSMANLLSSGDSDIENTNFVRIFGRKTFDEFFKDYYPGVDPVAPAGTKYDFETVSTFQPDTNYPSPAINDVIEKPNPDNGSNSFVVGPSKTSNGKVILSNEPDLPLNLPSIWYLIHLNSDNMNVMGASIPGMPGVIIGFNNRIAWGNTNAQRDLVDWYYIEFKDQTRDEYKYDGKWLKTSKRVEEIEVDGARTYYDTVIYTHFGPVTYDKTFKGEEGKINFAMRYTAHDPSLEYKTVYEINRAKNYDEFVNAYKTFNGPPQNYSYADVEGNYAVWVHGKYPVKWKEQGKFLLDGRKRTHEWQKYIPLEQNVHYLNAERGWASSANQHPADSTYPYYVYDHNFEFYRNRRINERLALMNNITPNDVMKLQNDNYNYIASENLHVWLDSLDTASFATKEWEYYNMLKDWDFFNAPELSAPTVFECFQDHLMDHIWDEIEAHSESAVLKRASYFNTFYALKNHSNSIIFDKLSTNSKESVRDLINMAFKDAIDQVEPIKAENEENVQWYKFKNTTVRHMAGLAPFSVSEVKIGGNHNIVNAASSSHGPSWRMVVELGGSEVQCWGVYPGSQTGNPGNPLWGHLIDDWASGIYHPMYFGPQSDIPSENIVKTVQFKKD